MSKQAEFLSKIQSAAETGDFTIREIKFYDDIYPKIKIRSASSLSKIRHSIKAVDLNISKIINQENENNMKVFQIVFASL